MTIADVFRRITALLDQAGIAYMLTGSFASAYYGAPRTTQDIDLVVSASADQLRSLAHLLPSDTYYVDLDATLQANRHESMFNVLDLVTGWKIDFIIRKSRAFSMEEFQRRTPIAVEGIQVFAAIPEDLIVSKLEWAKPCQSYWHIEDVAGILKLRWSSLNRNYLEKWIGELQLRTQWDDARQAADV
ncbi:MAG: hypothetical protein DMG60_18030 [Acidobacteria bacterium]|nr:MAG: hypothetical protein DMG60_18030 [Acidobacteriota bacterium]